VANGWNVGKKKPQNVYKYFKSLGQLITVFPAKGGWSFVADGKFYGPFPTQEYAQHEAQRFAEPAPADSPGDEEENTSMSEPNSNAAQQEAPQYVTKARFDKLLEVTKELVAFANTLEARLNEEIKVRDFTEKTHGDRLHELEATIRDLKDVLLGNGIARERYDLLQAAAKDAEVL
jgi:hypothetical protein